MDGQAPAGESGGLDLSGDLCAYEWKRESDSAVGSTDSPAFDNLLLTYGNEKRDSKTVLQKKGW